MTARFEETTRVARERPAGREHDAIGEVRELSLDASHELHPRHLGHLQVAQDHVEVASRFSEHAQRLLSAERGGDFVRVAQHAPVGLQQQRLVVDRQDSPPLD